MEREGIRDCQASADTIKLTVWLDDQDWKLLVNTFLEIVGKNLLFQGPTDNVPVLRTPSKIVLDALACDLTQTFNSLKRGLWSCVISADFSSNVSFFEDYIYACGLPANILLFKSCPSNMAENSLYEIDAIKDKGGKKSRSSLPDDEGPADNDQPGHVGNESTAGSGFEVIPLSSVCEHGDASYYDKCSEKLAKLMGQGVEKDGLLCTAEGRLTLANQLKNGFAESDKSSGCWNVVVGLELSYNIHFVENRFLHARKKGTHILLFQGSPSAEKKKEVQEKSSSGTTQSGHTQLNQVK